MKQNKSLRYSTYLILTVCTVFLTFSLLHGYFSIAARGWLWIPLACAMCLSISLEVLQSKQFVCLLFYFLILFIQIISGKSSTTNNYLVLNFMSMLWAASFPYLLKGKMDDKIIKTFVLAELFVVVVTSILTIFVDLRNPGVVRQTVSYINLGRSDLARVFYRMGVCEYPFPHAIPIIIPAIVSFARNRKLSLRFRFFSILLVALLLYLVFISGVTTAIILSFFATIATLFISRVSKRKTYIRLAILIVIAIPFANEDVVLSVLSRLEGIVPVENSFHGKIVSFENTIMYDEAEGSVQAREDRYNMSWESFKENPLIGGSGEVISGGHSVILDTFGAYGILGGIPFLLFLFFHLRFLYRRIPDNSKTVCFIGIICFVTMLATKNMSNVYTWLFVSSLLPMLLLYGQVIESER